MTATARERIPLPYVLTMLVVGAAGLFAAFQLTLDKFAVLENPHAQLNCSINPFIQCTRNLGSWQGALFGFPNPVIGLIGWSLVITIAMGIVAGARYARWFWIAADAGLAAALVFCVWLMTQSFYVIGTICIWCALTWAAAITAVVATTGLNLARGVFGDGGRAAGRVVFRWSPVIVLVLLLVIVLLAQLRFDLLGQLLH